MPVTMTWNTFAELKPNHSESVVYLKVSRDWTGDYFEPKEDCVEYQWEEFNEDGPTGTSTCYTEGDLQCENERLVILLDGYEPADSYLWMTSESYLDFLEENLPTRTEE
jgi:hypothetical protein